MTTYFNDLFTGTGDITAHTPNTGFDSGTWQGTPGGITLSGGVASNPGTVTYDLSSDAIYGDANTPTFGIPTSYQINFTFKTGANVAPYVDGHAGMRLDIYTGGDYSSGDGIQMSVYLEAVPAGGWQVVLYDGTTDYIEAVTVATNTEYPGTLVVTPGSQVLTLAGKTLNGSGTPVGIYGLNEIDIIIGYGHGIAELSITDIIATSTMTINSTLPQITGTLRGGGTAAGAMPAVTSLMRGGGTLLGSALPAMEARLIGGSRAPHTIDAVLPMVAGSMRAGNNLRSELPGMQASMAGTTTVLLAIDVALPSIQASIVGTTGTTGQLNAGLPMVQASMKAGVGVSGALPMLDADMAGTTGGVGRISVDLPGLTAEMSATLGLVSIIEAALPMLVPGPFGQIVSVLPMMQATLDGRTVVSVTYEAYAVNLRPGPKMPNQVTRYTNFPFNQIVRFQGRYIGVADDGLYQLGGETDYDPDTPAGPPWAWHTAITDFNSSQHKNVREAMFAGRLGPRATAAVSVREATDRTYAATIVRGTSAQNHRIKMGRGLKARYWSFGLSDAAGGECDVDRVEFDVAELGRKL